jgi:hypothetical protein
VAQVVEYLPIEPEALSSNPSVAEEEEEEEEQNFHEHSCTGFCVNQVFISLG